MTSKDEDAQQILQQQEMEEPSRIPVKPKVLRLMRKYMPLWTKVLDQGESMAYTRRAIHNIDGTELDLGNAACCIVGEMHGFDRGYGSHSCDCTDCYGKPRPYKSDYCLDCRISSTDVCTSDPNQFYPALEKAVLHFDTMHAK